MYSKRLQTTLRRCLDILNGGTPITTSSHPHELHLNVELHEDLPLVDLSVPFVKIEEKFTSVVSQLSILIQELPLSDQSF